MRLLIATGLYPPDIGGPATYTVFLEKHLPRQGIDLTVIPFTRFRRFPPLIRHLLYLGKLIWNARGCDVIYALDTVSVGVPALIAAFTTRKKLLLRVPGDYAWEQGQQRFGITETLDEYRLHQLPIAVRFLFRLQCLVARHASRVIVPSEYMKRVVSSWGIDPTKIVRIYSELKPFEGTRKKESQEEFIVMTSARLVPWKGVDALIHTVVNLREAGVPIVLQIAGDGVCRKALETLVTEKHAENFVTFLGSLPRRELGERLAYSDVFVLNTSYEGLSHQLLEVMSLNIPIITTPVGGNIEIITHEETGLMVPFNDVKALQQAIERLYNDRSLGEQLAAKAHTTLTRFSEEVIVNEITHFMHSIWKSSR